MAGAQMVIDLATALVEERAVLEFFRDLRPQPSRGGAAAASAHARWYRGTDRTDNGYCRAKVAQEADQDARGIPYTIVRSTQFLDHDGTDSLLIYKLTVLLMELTETLRAFIEEGGDWERKATTLAGVSIIRLPATKNRPASLAIDINPLGENRLPMKKKGIMIMNATELAAFRAVFNNEKADSLVKALEEIFPERKSAAKTKKTDVVQL